MTTLFSVLRQRGYSKYALAAILTSLGSGMQFVALSWFVYRLTGSASAIGWVLFIAMLPGILFSPWVGALVDRWNPRHICIVTDVVRALVLLGLGTAMRLGVADTPVVYASAFLLAASENFFQPAVAALVRNIVPREDLLPANTLGNMSMQVGLLSGAGIGGVLVAVFGASMVVFLNVCTFVVSALLTVWIGQAGDRRRPAAAGAPARFADEFRATAAYVRAHPHIVWLAILQMFVYITLFTCNTLLPAFVAQELGGGASAFGAIDAAWGAGAMLGGFALGYIVRRFDRRQFGLAGLLLLAVALYSLQSAHTVPHAFCAYLLLGFLTCVIRVNTDTILVSEVDPAYFGKVKATITMFISYMGLGVYAFVGVFGGRLSIRTMYLVIGVAVFVGWLLAMLPRIGMRRLGMDAKPPAFLPD